MTNSTSSPTPNDCVRVVYGAPGEYEMTEQTAPPAEAPARKVLVPRHSALVRTTHWINVISLLILLMSGLQIFNAHPSLYWGAKTTFAKPWLAMRAFNEETGLKGVTSLGDLKFDPTGLLAVWVYDGAP